MGRLVGLLKDVIADSIQNKNQGQQGGFPSNRPNSYGPRRDQQYGYDRDDNYYRGIGTHLLQSTVKEASCFGAFHAHRQAPSLVTDF